MSVQTLFRNTGSCEMTILNNSLKWARGFRLGFRLEGIQGLASKEMQDLESEGLGGVSRLIQAWVA